MSQHGPSADVQGWPLISQFSSIGKLGSSADSWLCGEWLSSLAEVKGGHKAGPLPELKLVSTFSLLLQQSWPHLIRKTFSVTNLTHAKNIHCFKKGYKYGMSQYDVTIS